MAIFARVVHRDFFGVYYTNRTMASFVSPTFAKTWKKGMELGNGPQRQNPG
jgi:hypothetical protein